MQQIDEKAYKQKHYPGTIWGTSRGNFRVMLPNKKERSFKTWAEGKQWLDAYREKQSILKHLEVKRITPKTELRHISGFIRRVLEKGQEMEIDYALELRKVLAAITKIHTRMID